MATGNVSKVEQKMVVAYIAGNITNWFNPFGKLGVVRRIKKMFITINSVSLLPVFYPEEGFNRRNQLLIQRCSHSSHHHSQSQKWSKCSLIGND